MLVLTRRAGESIYVGDDIVVKLLNYNKNNVALGFDAPEDIKIYRKEIYEKIKTYRSIWPLQKIKGSI